MRFRLFGINVEIHISFWITGVLLGMVRRTDSEVSQGAAVAIWMAIVFVSVLVHELGHALVVKRYGIEPEITLYALGGLTRFQPSPVLRRRDHVLISLAGPFAGFLLGGLVAAFRFGPYYMGLSPIGVFTVDRLLFVNIVWGVVNLLPVLPFDGGHVLLSALGPKHTQLTAAVSTLVGFLVAALFIHLGSTWGAVLFGLAAFQSYRRFAAEGASEGEGDASPARERPPPELAALLQTARHALAEDDLDRAASLAQKVLEATDPPADARRAALEVIAWTHLLAGRADTAADVLQEVRRLGAPDAGLEGSVLLARNDLAGARRVLEAARARGDDRKHVVGPLVQVLIAQGEVGHAAELALGVIDTLSADDARRIAGLAFDHGADAPAARLYAAMFDRLHQPEDAYEAARAEARAGRSERALDLLRLAVEAGFSDAARAWSDAALAPLRAGPPGLEAVLPRP